jgi:hypothetical protein
MRNSITKYQKKKKNSPWKLNHAEPFPDESVNYCLGTIT